MRIQPRGFRPNFGKAGARLGSAMAMVTVFVAGCSSSIEDQSVDSKKEPLYYEKMFPAYTGNGPYSVAVIGGGTAGLSTAWNLRRLGHKVVVYEQGPGTNGNIGNVQTVSMNVPIPNSPNTEVRWADAGVNDFNTKTYRYHTFMLDYLGVKHRALEDSAMWGNTVGASPQFFYQVDSKNYVGSLPSAKLDNIQKDGDYFFNTGWEIATNIKFAEWSVDQYIAWKRTPNANDPNSCFFAPNPNPQRFPQYSNSCYSYTNEFVNYNLKARISNMYFTTESEPGLMPIRGVLYYYILQEGLGPSGPPAPDRRYYVGGAHNWLSALIANLQSSPPNPPFPEVPPGAIPGGVMFQWCANVQSFNASGPSKSVTWSGSTAAGCVGGGSHVDSGFNYVVLATHVLGAKTILNNSGAGAPAALTAAVNLIPGDTATATMHTYAAAAGNGSLDNNRAERTYNIYSYDGYTNSYPTPPPSPPCRPYRITYIENRHQDDVRNPDLAAGPHTTFYTTENPSVPSINGVPCIDNIAIPANQILPQTNGLPAQGIGTVHQYMTNNTLLAQRQILGDRTAVNPGLQGTWGVFIGAGWVRGAGLQEEVFINAVQVAAQIDNPTAFIDEHIYDYRANAPRYAPLYIAQIADTRTTFSGTWQGGTVNSALSGVCRQTFEFNVQAGHNYTISTCNNFTGDTWLNVQDPNGTGCTCSNDNSCGLGSQCSCTATASGKAIICASTNSNLAASWNYSVTDTRTGTGTGVYTYTGLQNSQYAISCTPLLGAGVINVSGSNVTCPNGSSVTCASGASVTCDVRADSTLIVQAIQTSLPPPFGVPFSYSLGVTAVKAIRSSETLPTLPYDFSLPFQPPGGEGGGACTDPNRSCPVGYVATAMTVYEDMWARKAYLTCKQLSADTNNVITLSSPVVQTIACGNTGTGNNPVTYDCDTTSGNPAVIVGQRVWAGAYGWAYRVRPICQYIKSGKIFYPDGYGNGPYMAQCPPDQSVRSINEYNGDVMNQASLVCAKVLPLSPKQTCMGTYPSDYANASLAGQPFCGIFNQLGNCDCSDACTANGNCCPDKPLFCPTCTGKRVGGYCWHLGAQNQSCDQVCTPYGQYSIGTLTFAGSDGSDAYCKSVLSSLISGYNQSNFGQYGGSTGLGCMYYSPGLWGYRDLSPTISSSSSYQQRACACQN